MNASNANTIMEPFSASALPAPSTSWQVPEQDEQQQLADFDLDVLFDDDEQHQAFVSSDSSNNEMLVTSDEATSSSSSSSSSSDAERCSDDSSSSTMDDASSSSTPSTTTTTTTTTSSSQAVGNKNLMMTPPMNTTDGNFVNVYMVFDPLKGSFVCPEQLLSFQTESGEVKTVAIGPTFVDDSQMEAMLKLSSNSNSNKTATSPTSSSLFTPPPTMNTTTTAPSPTTVMTNSTTGAATPVPSTVGSGMMQMPSTPKKKSKKTKANKSLPTPPPPTVVTATADLPPLRALSAYNFFFRDERDRILNDVHQEHDDWSVAKQQKLLQDHWGRDRTQKRRHRKTHGKIDFTTLSRLISSRWKKLPVSKKDFYRQTAATDFARYQDETSIVNAAATNRLSSLPKFSSVVG